MSLEPPGGTQLRWHLDFNPVRTILDSWLQNYKIINMVCFKLLSLWQFVTVAIKTNTTTVPVSGSACKETRSCHNTLTSSKKLSKPKYQQHFQYMWERWGHTANHYPSDWRDLQQIQRITVYWNRDWRVETACLRNQCWGRKTWTVTDTLLEAQHGQVWELETLGSPSLQEAPQLCDIYH